MSGWQAVYITILVACLAVAWWRDGSFPRRISAVMAFNLLGTVLLSSLSQVGVGGAPHLAVAAVDTLSATFLVLGNRREMAVAALFLLMVLLHIGAFYLALNPYTLYAVIDGLAYAQCLVIGGVRGRPIAIGYPSVGGVRPDLRSSHSRLSASTGDSPVDGGGR